MFRDTEKTFQEILNIYNNGSTFDSSTFDISGDELVA